MIKPMTNLNNSSSFPPYKNPWEGNDFLLVLCYFYSTFARTYSYRLVSLVIGTHAALLQASHDQIRWKRPLSIQWKWVVHCIHFALNILYYLSACRMWKSLNDQHDYYIWLFAWENASCQFPKILQKGLFWVCAWIWKYIKERDHRGRQGFSSQYEILFRVVLFEWRSSSVMHQRPTSENQIMYFRDPFSGWFSNVWSRHFNLELRSVTERSVCVSLKESLSLQCKVVLYLLKKVPSNSRWTPATVSVPYWQCPSTRAVCETESVELKVQLTNYSCRCLIVTTV